MMIAFLRFDALINLEIVGISVTIQVPPFLYENQATQATGFLASLIEKLKI